MTRTTTPSFLRRRALLGRINPRKIRAIFQDLFYRQQRVAACSPQQMGSGGSGLLPQRERRIHAVGQTQHSRLEMAENFGCHRVLTDPIGSHANSKNRVRSALAQTHEAQLRESRLTPSGTLLSKVGEIFGRIRHVKRAAIRGHQSQSSVKATRLALLAQWLGAFLPERLQRRGPQPAPGL
ncbi:MAG TPA: hypothetical protein VIS96_09290 [Terrimicrobiaceae bacterium]